MENVYYENIAYFHLLDWLYFALFYQRQTKPVNYGIVKIGKHEQCCMIAALLFSKTFHKP
jgi:hypothetical protein